MDFIDAFITVARDTLVPYKHSSWTTRINKSLVACTAIADSSP
jgi:hypothetical protein